MDLNTLSLHPVFWPQNGDRIPVLRATWFMGDSSKPCNWELARELEKAYRSVSYMHCDALMRREIKPWTQSYRLEFTKAVSQGAAAEEKLQYALPDKFGEGLSIIFHDSIKCRVIK